MGLTEKLSELFGKVSTGDVPQDRDSVDACLVHVFLALLNVWMTKGQQGALELSDEVDNLVRNLKNKEDAIVKTFNAIERMTLFSGLNALTKQRESLHASTTEDSNEAKAAQG